VRIDPDTGATRPYGLTSVSCPSISFCAAVDYAGNVVTTHDPRGGRRAWRLAHLSTGFLTGVSCASASLCVAVNTAGQMLTSRRPTGGAGQWTSTQLADAPGLSAVSCPSASLCVAVGNSGTAVVTRHPTGGASAWTAIGVPTSVPADCGKYGPGTDCSANLTAVSCTFVSLCVAVDSEGDVISSRDVVDRSAWRAVQIDRSTGLTGVSCPTAAFCAVVDGGGNVLTSRVPTGHAWRRASINNGGFGNA